MLRRSQREAESANGDEIEMVWQSNCKGSLCHPQFWPVVLQNRRSTNDKIWKGGIAAKKKKEGRKKETPQNKNEGILVIAVKAITDEIVSFFNIQSTNLNPLFTLHVVLPKEPAWARADKTSLSWIPGKQKQYAGHAAVSDSFSCQRRKCNTNRNCS